MDYFDKTLHTILESTGDTYINPDLLMISAERDETKASTTFAYSEQTGLLYGPGTENHYSTIPIQYFQAVHDLRSGEDIPAGLEGRASWVKQKDLSYFYVDDFIRSMLGQKAFVVAFWNDNKADYQLFTPCLEALQRERLLHTPIFTSDPILGVMPLKYAMKKHSRSQKPVVDPAEVKKLKELHNMRYGKKEAMLSLGLNPYSKPHEMQASMQDTGIIGPGQKWWAQYSENRNR